jgi:transposase
VKTVSIDMCSAFRAAARQMLPGAQVCVDPFHLVQLANKMVTAVRWRIVRESMAAAAARMTPSTASSACSCATWKTCATTSSPSCGTPWPTTRR